MSFDLIEYYKALNGESSLSNNTWHINYDKRHAFRVYSGVEGYNPSVEGMSLPPSEETTETIDIFSDKLGQKLNNTAIVIDSDGNETVELELGDRIVTIVMDQSGSMTWNDNGKFRYDIAKDLVEKIDINYPGDIKYNLIDYDSKFINVLLFGVVEETGINPYDIDSLNAMFQADEDANYDGIRVVRNTADYPTSPLDGEIVKDGFVSRILDDELTEGQTYYYTVYTYDNLGRFSNGVNIKVTPRDRIMPRGISVFRTAVETQDLSLGEPFLGSGVNRDDNTIGIWHMDEGKGRSVYDFSDTGAILTHSNETPIWYGSRYVPSGISGLFFDGENDYAYIDGESEYIRDFAGSQLTMTVAAWIYPYDNNMMTIISSVDGNRTNFDFRISSGVLSMGTTIGGTEYAYFTTSSNIELYKWQHVCAILDTNEAYADRMKLYINGNLQPSTFSPGAAGVSDGNYYFTIGANRETSVLSQYFRGKITEVSIHDTVRSPAYINAQIINSPIFDGDGVEVDTEVIGIRDDNGDRLVVLDYEIPEDYNFSGGEVRIVKNEEHIPSWEEDGTIIHQTAASAGRTFVSDSDNFVLGEKYYYRIFSENSTGNISFLSDSPSLEITIPDSSINDYFIALSSAIPPPEVPSIGELITPGNGKVYLRWKQAISIDSRIERVKIYYSSIDYPVVSNAGGNIGQLVFTGLPTDTKFVHRGLSNNVSAYYTIVNIDKYGRPSNYNVDGTQSVDFLQASTTPTSSASEGTIPLVDVGNLHYEIRDNSSIGIGWDQPVKSPEDIDVYFDQTVVVYASLTDEFGEVLPEYASIKMYISSTIERETQADDVFDSISVFDFDDKDAYDFFVTRTDQGFLKATLRMTSNREIISQIKSATFTIQLKSYVPREGGYDPPNTAGDSTDPLSEYADLIAELTGGTEEVAQQTGGGNVFEYLSESFIVNFINPWEITLEPKFESQRVSERCYYLGTTPPPFSDTFLGIDNRFFYGVHMRSSSPFVARVKVTYKGEPVENASLQIAVWDAESDNLCAGAGNSDSIWGVPGDKLQPSQIVLPPDSNLSVLQGTEDVPGQDAKPISYVDIPLQAPDTMQAVKLFVKGERLGYSSVKDMYILFQNLLRINIGASAPNEDGIDVREQFSNAFVIHPDYPDLVDPYAISLQTPVSDLTIVQWGIEPIGSHGERSIYSTDSVPVTNGVYSYTRNGQARNVWMGPIQIGSSPFEETHEISATVVYEGMSVTAKSWIDLEYDPTVSTSFGARFLMEVDGSWKSNGMFEAGGWLKPELNPLWADGSHYKKIKIHRNPADDPEFSATDAFAICASDDDSQVFELNSGQIVNVFTGDDLVEILHGDITEETDPYTGLHYLTVEEKGFIDNGSAFIELNNEEVSDVTYFYIRANKFVPGAGRVHIDYLIDDDPINECLELKPSTGLFLRDLPEWEPYFTVSGTTTLFVNDQPLVLRGGGDFRTGIPPCPICLLEPLGISVTWRRVTDVFFSETIGDPSNDFLYTVVTTASNNHFRDTEGESLINNTSDIDIRVRILWKGEPAPDDTPVYTSIGDNTSGTLFLSNQNIYYTEDGYVDVGISTRRIPSTTTTEALEIYSLYDENGKTDRHIGARFSLTLDVKDIVIEPPVVEPPVDGGADPEVTTPFSGILHKYDIDTDVWSVLTGMSEGKGNFFVGEVNGKIYVMGGLLNNTLNISSKMEEYEIATDEWVDKTAMLNPRFGGMSVTIGNNIYTIGGIFQDPTAGNGLSVSTSVDVYHTDTDSWEELTSMPTISPGTFEEDIGVAFGVAQHVEVAGSNYIYIIGGIREITATGSSFSIREYSNRILRYHVEGNSWKKSGVLWTNELNTYQRIAPLSLTYDNKIIVFNGAQESGVNFIYPVEDFYIDIDDTFIDDFSDGEWINFGSGLFNGFPVAKFQSAMVRYDNNPSSDTSSEYYIMGGGNTEATSLDILENLSATSTGFNYVNSYGTNPSIALTPLLFGRHGPGAVYSDADGSPAIYLVGGYTIAQDNNFVDITFDI